MDRGGSATLQQGVVIPAHPLALNAQRKLDERRQVALTRYYCDAGAGGIAVGVHTTQFAIRDPQVGLFEPVLRLAAGAAAEFERRSGKRIMKVAGICGPTPQAVSEAEFARDAGYDIGLLSLAALPDRERQELLEHCRAVAREIPVFGFYLQPSVGGRLLSYEFWRGFCEIEGVVAIKVAPFNRYQTIDVVRGVVDSGRAGEIALYTGNDDNIIPDCLPNSASAAARRVFRGGLLGQWAVWTRRAVELLDESTLPRGGRAGRRGDPGGIGRAHGRQCRPVRRAQPLRRLHRRAARDSAAAGDSGGSLVSRPGRGSLSGPTGRDRPRASRRTRN